MSNVAVITGATDGIGYFCAEDLAGQGANLLLLARNLDKAQTCKASIEQAAGRECVEIVHADMGDLESVRRAAGEIRERHQKLDVLINNAGGGQSRRQLSAQGHELTLAVNHLGPYLLTRLLLERLLAAEAPRVIFTSSVGHRHSALNFDDLGVERGWNNLKAYGRSKLMNLLTAMELHRRYADRGLAASSMHPGGVRTGIWKKAGFAATLVGVLGAPFMISSKKGADTLTWLASSPEAAQPEGQYFYKRKARRTASFATPEVAERLWRESTKLVGLENDDHD